MRVAIVNDLTLAMEALRRLLVEMPDVQIAWTARDGAQAVAAAARDRPDLILMDMVMPVMDGAEATRLIMRASPCAIVVVTASVGANADRVFEALSNGALDATETPSLRAGTDPARDMLRRKIELVRRLQRVDVSAERATTGSAAVDRLTAPRSGFAARPCSPPVGPAVDPAPRVALIGASTGGPQALAEVLASVPRDFPFAIVAVQHLDADFVPGLATWLARETGRRVEIAASGAFARPSVMSLASGTEHLTLNASARFCTTSEPADAVHRPSIDVLFESAVCATLRPFGAALLTGMGRDGADGLLRLRAAGWHTIAQDQATSVVWGMPGSAVRNRAAVATLPLAEIGPELMRLAARAAVRG